MIKHHSHNIQNVIQRELFAAKKSIKICVAWFTNDLLFQPLILQLNMGVKVELILNKDEINLSDSNDVDFDQFVANGGCLYWNTTDKLLHHKFCIIDDRVVITGSYNWTNKAEYNYEDITVCTEDSESINHYQKIFDKLSQEFPLLKSSETLRKKKNITSSQEQTYTCSIKYTTTDGKIIEISCDKLPDGVKINSNTYRNGLGEIVFDKEITKIGAPFISDKYLAFGDCETLRSITIPDSVTTIGNSAFSHCSSLTTIIIPDNVTTIGRWAFSGCSSLTSIIIPDNVTTIGLCAFSGCSSLTSITIPDSVTTIGWYAFAGCSSLKEFKGKFAADGGRCLIKDNTIIAYASGTTYVIPDSVTTIGRWAFSRCSSLTSVTIPDSVTKIGGGAFSGCSSLKEFKGKFAADGGRCLINDNTIIAYAAASGTTYAIPDSVTTIGRWAFSRCSSLTSITIPDSVTKIGGAAFSGCSNLTTITIPDSVTEIGNSAFSGCSSLASITIPDSVTTIGNLAFYSCSSLTSVTIGNSVTEIGYRAFSGCSSLTTITIGDSVTEIHELAFGDCRNLTKLYCKSLNPPHRFGGAGWLVNVRIYVPCGSVEEYKKSAGWSEYADKIEGYDFK